MNNLITEVDILEESKDCFLTYTEEVLTDRAVPSAEDGLLSVHRKLLWTMEEILKMNSKAKYKKSASVVGSTLSSSYYHGDTACYGALCKIAQPYLMRYPLIDGDGNLGTQEGNGMEAASRYTNCRPSIYADLMMNDFNKNVVPLKETYNGEYMEPVVLPSLLPNAIINGRETIAIGLAHNSLPHNLSEVCDAIVAHLKKGSKLTVDEVMEYIKGPDFPLENDIINSKDIREAFRTGHSAVSLKVRGKYEIIKDEIIFYTIPYRTYRNKIRKQISDNIEIFDSLIDDFSDESNVGKNRLVFKVKKGVNPDTVVQKLFSLTDLQTSLSYNMNYIVNGTPKMCSMMDLIEAYVNHQIKVLIAATEFDKAKAEARKHILEGLILIISNIDKAISLIKESNDKKEAAIKLSQFFNLTDIQANAVLDMKLAKLTKLDKDDLIKELEEKKLIIAECNKILENEAYRNETLIKKIILLKDKYGDERRTNLLNIEMPKEEKEVEQVIPEDVVIITSKAGDIKKIPLNSFKVQRRNGKGIKSEDDAILDTISTNTTDTLMVFTNKGKMYRLLVDNVPNGTNTSRGVKINTLINIEADEKVIAITSLHRKTDAKFVLFVTKNGLIKKTSIEEYLKIKRNTGIAAITLKEGDTIANVTFVKDEELLLVTKNGMSIRFKTDDIAPIGRTTVGVKGIKLEDNDEVLIGLPIHKLTDSIAVFTENGFGKKIKLEEFPIQGRAGKGVLIYKPTDITGKIAGASMVSDEDNVLVIGKPNCICISAKDIPELNRISMGNIMIKNSRIISVVKL